jgi:phospholipid transport system substrate-binding protein
MGEVMGMRGRSLRWLLGVVLLGFAGTWMPASAATEADAARRYVSDLGEQTVHVLSQTSAPGEREAQLGQVLSRGFDLDYLGRLAVGRAWREMNAAQRDDYQAAFNSWVLRTYAARLGAYSGEIFAVTGAEGAGEDVMVHSEIRGGSGPATKIAWRVRASETGLRIIDVVVEGVSMVITHRNEFQAIVQRQGIEGLIGTLRARAERASAQPA